MIIPDPNELADDPGVGEAPGDTTTEIGKQGVGGLTTTDAEESYANPADQNSSNETEDDTSTSGQNTETVVHGTLPQAGSIADVDSTTITGDPIGGVQTKPDETK